jgi:hypothetical protein
MVFPPGQGKSGAHLMHLWRQYLEQYAEHEGRVDEQIIVGAYHAAEVIGALTLILDRERKYRSLIEQRIGYFVEGVERAQSFEDRLVNGTFSLYNHLNTLAHQFTVGHADAESLIHGIDEQVRVATQSADQVYRSAFALRAAFPLMSLITLALDQEGSMSAAIRQIDQRFAAGAGISAAPWPQLVNALYRMVEMAQLMTTLSDPDLRGQVEQIAARFQEEDNAVDPMLKVRNGFCRLFELAHILTTHLDEIL